ncbi:hypothetical protein LOAG_05959 [Loa loa]|uniref:Uncharacterized protein n=1 Tax=Loa loa TaxID=7209 RepID=A0A1S0U0N2_LOALO|nr:hypothetical protein LOAG_05959 [Loa loa]EFO22522.2 hypothetical protein LOAG_05959 [Loa loa]
MYMECYTILTLGAVIRVSVNQSSTHSVTHFNSSVGFQLKERVRRQQEPQFNDSKAQMTRLRPPDHDMANEERREQYENGRG